MTEEEKERYAAGFAVHVGVDTGKSFHKLVARRPGDVRSTSNFSRLPIWPGPSLTSPQLGHQ